MITANHIHKAYPAHQVQALTDISFTINAGQIEVSSTSIGDIGQYDLKLLGKVESGSTIYLTDSIDFIVHVIDCSTTVITPFSIPNVEYFLGN